MRKLPIFLLVVVALLAALASSAAGNGEDNRSKLTSASEGVEEEDTRTDQEALLEDATWIANDQGLPVDEVFAQIDFQVETSFILDELHANGVIDQKRFAGSVFDNNGMSPGLRILYTKPGKGQPEAAAAIERHFADVSGNVTVVEEYEFSIEELTAQQRDVMERLWNDDDFATSGASIDIETQIITVRVQETPGTSDSARREMARDALKSLPNGQVNVEVVPEEEVDQLTSSASVYGGTELLNSGVAVCTSAFTVTHDITGEKGKLTAEHCYPGINKTRTAVFGGLINEYYEDGYYGFYGDAAWLSTNHNERPKFWNGNMLSQVTGVIRSYSINQWVCRYGQASGNKACGTTYDTYECSTVGVCDLILNRAPNIGGDSGGPWSVGRNAYGLTHARRLIALGNLDSLIVKISVAEDLTNTTVKEA